MSGERFPKSVVHSLCPSVDVGTGAPLQNWYTLGAGVLISEATAGASISVGAQTVYNGPWRPFPRILQRHPLRPNANLAGLPSKCGRCSRRGSWPKTKPASRQARPTMTSAQACKEPGLATSLELETKWLRISGRFCRLARGHKVRAGGGHESQPGPQRKRP